MSNHLTFAKKTLVLSSLVEGNSIRSIERISGVHRDTIMRLLVQAGEKATLIHDINFAHCEQFPLPNISDVQQDREYMLKLFYHCYHVVTGGNPKDVDIKG